MVPRRIGDVSCGENHTLWQTQRRHEEGGSHPCSLQQWSHQRLLTSFSLLLSRGSDIVILKSANKFIFKSRIHSELEKRKTAIDFWRPENINGHNNKQIDWVNPECSVHNVGLFLRSKACSLRGDTVVVTRIHGFAVTLLLCSQPLPEAANGFAHQGREGRSRGVGDERGADRGRLDWVWQGNALKRGPVRWFILKHLSIMGCCVFLLDGAMLTFRDTQWSSVFCCPSFISPVSSSFHCSNFSPRCTPTEMHTYKLSPLLLRLLLFFRQHYSFIHQTLPAHILSVSSTLAL